MSTPEARPRQRPAPPRGADLPPDPRPVVVFVHGLWMTGFEQWLLMHRVRRMGFVCHRFYYQSAIKPIWHNAAKLHRFVRDLGPGPVHIVAHSLGGLVTLRMLRDHPEVPAGRVVLIGSPVKGSSVAAQMNKRFWTRWMVWRAADEALVPREPQDWRVHHPVGVIAGTHSIGIGHWFGGLTGTNDGTVNATETQLEGASDYVEIPHNHSTLLLSKRVARQCAAFIREGRFTR